MATHLVYRIQCDGPGKEWLRNGRAAPSHWGPMYAESFDTAGQVEQAAKDAGWADGICVRCTRRREGR